MLRNSKAKTKAQTQRLEEAELTEQNQLYSTQSQQQGTFKVISIHIPTDQILSTWNVNYKKNKIQDIKFWREGRRRIKTFLECCWGIAKLKPKHNSQRLEAADVNEQNQL